MAAHSDAIIWLAGVDQNAIAFAQAFCHCSANCIQNCRGLSPQFGKRLRIWPTARRADDGQDFSFTTSPTGSQSSGIKGIYLDLAISVQPVYAPQEACRLQSTAASHFLTLLLCGPPQS